MKVLLENLLRHEDGETVTADDIIAMKKWMSRRKSNREIAYRPARTSDAGFHRSAGCCGPRRNAETPWKILAGNPQKD